MLIPREFAIKGSIWRVEYKWNLTYNKSPVDGLCDPEMQVIYISRSLDKESKFFTFLHEWMHAVLDTHKIGFNDDSLTQSHEGLIVHTLEAEFRDNFTLKWKRSK